MSATNKVITRLFTDALRELRYGESLDELTTALMSVVEAVEKTGKPGELSLKLKIKRTTGGALQVDDVIATKIPQPVKGSSIFFATPDGNLVRNDPRQKTLELKEVPQGESKQLKDATNG